jgi:hypothetical protein
VARVAQLVHDLDVKDEHYGLPEGPAVGRLIDGLRLVHADDHALLEHGIEMFEALARSFTADPANAGTGSRSRRARVARKRH